MCIPCHDYSIELYTRQMQTFLLAVYINLNIDDPIILMPRRARVHGYIGFDTNNLCY